MLICSIGPTGLISQIHSQKKRFGRSRTVLKFIRSSGKVDSCTQTFQGYELTKKMADIELELQSGHGITMRGSKEQAGAVTAFTKHMQTKLAKKPSVMEQILPSFPPACRRLTPGPGYLEALSADNVDVISEPIVQIVADGVITSDGKHRQVDAISCATGFDTTFTGRFPIIGEKSVLLSEKWKHIPATYLSLATDGFPNYFIYLGPASGLGTGNLLVLLERLADYFIECVAKMQRDNIRAMKVKKSAVKQFVAHSDKYFEQTVFSMRCRSWYKDGTEDGRVNALWPGNIPNFAY
jgi:cation diffusion facilitator CzcD-associated flavoprotein CzcO